jgi:hypothetical protein
MSCPNVGNQDICATCEGNGACVEASRLQEALEILCSDGFRVVQRADGRYRFAPAFLDMDPCQGKGTAPEEMFARVMYLIETGRVKDKRKAVA